MSWDIEKSLSMVAELRGVSARSWPSLCSADVAPRMAKRRASKAVKDGYLERQTIDRHVVYTATAKAIRAFAPAVPVAWAKTNLSLLRFAYWRSEVWAALRQAGFSVTHTAKGLARIRRYLIDNARGEERDVERRRRALRASEKLALHYWTPCSCGVKRRVVGKEPCPHCGSAKLSPRLALCPGFCSVCGAMTERADELHLTPVGPICTVRSKGTGTALPYDVAVKDGVPMLVVIDRPYRAVETFVSELPVDITPEQAPLDVLWLPTDGSYSRQELTWLASPRTASMHRLLEPKNRRRQRAVGVRPQNTNLLPWVLLDLPDGVLPNPSPGPEALRDRIIRGAAALAQGASAKWPRHGSSMALVALDADTRAALLRVRDRIAPERPARAVAVACLTAALGYESSRFQQETSA